jgi:hypothetical protein
MSQIIIKPKVKELPPLDLSTNELALRRVGRAGSEAILSVKHNVFNPIKWLKKGDNPPVPSSEMGWNALTVTRIQPLYLRIEYQNATDIRGTMVYQFVVTREASTNAALQRPVTIKSSVGNRNEVFALREAKGPREDPAELMLDVKDFKEPVTVSKDKPFVHLAGYAADLRYEPPGRGSDSKTLNRQRAGQKMTLGGESYNIVAIGPDDITLEGQTLKRKTIRWSAAR